MQIISVTPESANVGDSVTIKGSGLPSGAANSSVTFNGVKAKTVEYSPEGLTVTVPDGATSGPIAVAGGGEASEFYFLVTPTLRDEPVEDIIRAENQKGKPGMDPSSDKAKMEVTPTPQQVAEQKPFADAKREQVDPTKNEDPKKSITVEAKRTVEPTKPVVAPVKPLDPSVKSAK